MAKVTQLANNQFIVTDGEKTILQSYQSVIAIKENGNVTLDRETWNYSPTTSKYRNRFLNETTKETQQKIDAGVYILADLN